MTPNTEDVYLVLTSSTSGKPEELVHRKSSHQQLVQRLCRGKAKDKGRRKAPLVCLNYHSSGSPSAPTRNLIIGSSS